MGKQNELTLHVQNFFQSHLSVERGLRAHTIFAYRDTLKLFIKYLTGIKKKPVRLLVLEDFTAKSVLAFLEDLEKARGNTVKTRNQRLAILKTFFGYLLNVDPTRANQYERIFHLKGKRLPYRPIEYLFKKEFNAILNAIDRTSLKGRRDYAAFLFLYNTGARAQELCDLKTSGVRFEKPYLVSLTGKGDKVRQVPLWNQTIEVLRGLVNENSLQESDYLFRNMHGKPLTRFGLRYLLTYYVKKAAQTMPELLRKNIGPHTIRHTTAMHLLQSGVDITIIKTWLGHVDLNTTHGYLELDLEMKEKALQKNKIKQKGDSVWKLIEQEKDLLDWLGSF